MKRHFDDTDKGTWVERDIQKALDQTKWEITIDNEEDMYTCPECECRMIARWYDLAVGTKGYSFCPYCGADIRRETQMTWADL